MAAMLVDLEHGALHIYTKYSEILFASNLFKKRSFHLQNYHISVVLVALQAQEFFILFGKGNDIPNF